MIFFSEEEDNLYSNQKIRMESLDAPADLLMSLKQLIAGSRLEEYRLKLISGLRFLEQNSLEESRTPVTMASGAFTSEALASIKRAS